MLLRWVSLFVWAAVAASAVFWGLRFFAKSPTAPPQTQVADGAGPARGDLTRLLGADPPPPQVATAAEPAADARFSLLGVVSPRGSAAPKTGVALISVDGKPAKAFRVGAVVDGQNVLQSVNARGAALGPREGPALIALNIPPPAPAATGQLPPAAAPLAPMPPRALPGGPAHMQNHVPMQAPMQVPPLQVPPQQVPQPSQVPPQVEGGLLK